jgi:TolB-like protein
MEPHRTQVDGYARECFALARARKWDECAALARKWLDADTGSVDAALYLLNALKAPATADAYRRALDEYTLLELRLDREQSQTPHAHVTRLADSIRENLAPLTASRAIPEPTIHTAPAPPAANHADAGVASRRTRRPASARLVSIPFAAALFLGATSFSAGHAASRPLVEPSAMGPSVAFADVRNLAGDSATAWLELGLPQMVLSDISRLPGIKVVSPETVREARQALNLPRGWILSRDDIARLGARSGARWVVSGGIARGQGRYVLDMTLHDAAGKSDPRALTVTSPSLIALADEAATQLASLTTAKHW